MSIPGSAEPLLLAQQDTGYRVERSLRFNSSDSAFCSRTFSSAGNRRTWTWAGWVKRSELGDVRYIFSAPDSSGDAIRFGSSSDNKLFVGFFAPATSAYTSISTAAEYRDPSAWLHIVVATDTTQATASDRVKLYVNGVQVTAFSSATYPAQNAEGRINTADLHRLGRPGTDTVAGYLADVFFIDGQALTPSSFTEVSATTGQLIPKAYTGTFTGNSFWLKFADNSAATATTLGKDSSGLGNNWTPNNLSVTAGAGNDSLTDTPTSYGTDTGAGGEVRGNYCTWNPLASTAYGPPAFSDGNLQIVTATTTNAYSPTRGTISVSSGKWYWEVTPLNGTAVVFGIGDISEALPPIPGETAKSYGYASSGNKSNNAVPSSYGASYTTNDVIGFALDLDAGTLVCYKNGVSQGTAFSGLSGTFTPFVSDNTSGGSATIVGNFGQRPFAYPVSGYKCLCDTSLPAPVVAKPSTVMDVLTWTGDGTGNRSFSGLQFSPDFVWAKMRSLSGYSHLLYDAVRGAGSTKDLSSDLTESEGSAAVAASAYGYLSSFDSQGFSTSVGSSGGNNYFNQNTRAYVAWAFDAGTTTTTNTAGSINSTVSVRANPSAGFSVVGYSGASGGGSWGHGLNAEPIFIIFKRRNAAQNWFVFHKTSGSWRVFEGLNNTNADSNYSGSMSASSTVVSLPSIAEFTTDPSSNYIAYCFAPVNSYSAFGAYQGNGSTDGPFVYTGFRPRFLITKRTDSSTSGDWNIVDTARGNYNVVGPYVYANQSAAEGTASIYDLLSNGFKIRESGAGTNANGSTYIYMAFAENPFQYARAR